MSSGAKLPQATRRKAHWLHNDKEAVKTMQATGIVGPVGFEPTLAGS
jgi:hypothetical protein